MAAVALALVLAAVVPGLERAAGRSGAAAAAAKRPPNFLFVLVDDQATNSFKRRYMPQTFRRIVDKGANFTSAIAAPPLCCPDRAGIITGQYPHNHGVFSNHPGYTELRDPGNTLPVWLKRAGYRTALIGKFLNGYDIAEGTAPAPGFDRWFELLTDPQAPYYGYRVSDQGVERHYGHRRRDYVTDVLTRQAVGFLRRQRDSARPFFLWLPYSAPHLATLSSGPCAGRNPAPPDRSAYLRFRRAGIPRTPAFNEADVSDKPEDVASLPRLGAEARATVRRRWRCTLAAVQRVDADVGTLMDRLRRFGELSDTIVIYLSDNGFFFGDHRLRAGKGFVYEPALRVPFAMRVPRAFRPHALSHRVKTLVSNQDIAPTVLAYAGAPGPPIDPCASAGDCRRMDGRGLQPLLGGTGTWPGGRGVLAEIDSRRLAAKSDPECGCAYEAIRTHRYVYSELADGERELYDLHTDPFELTNRANFPAYAQVQEGLAQRLALLEHCSGIQGRDQPTAAPFCE